MLKKPFETLTTLASGTGGLCIYLFATGSPAGAAIAGSVAISTALLSFREIAHEVADRCTPNGATATATTRPQPASPRA